MPLPAAVSAHGTHAPPLQMPLGQSPFTRHPTHTGATSEVSHTGAPAAQPLSVAPAGASSTQATQAGAESPSQTVPPALQLLPAGRTVFAQDAAVQASAVHSFASSHAAHRAPP